MEMLDLTDYAACRGYDPELWFPVNEDTATVDEQRAQTVEARAVCAGCPVRAECLEWAVDTGQRYGVWGGLTSAEREALVRARRAATAA